MTGHWRVRLGATPGFGEYQFIPLLRIWLTSIHLPKEGFSLAWGSRHLNLLRLDLTFIQMNKTCTTDRHSGLLEYNKLKSVLQYSAEFWWKHMFPLPKQEGKVKTRGWTSSQSQHSYPSLVKWGCLTMVLWSFLNHLLRSYYPILSFHFLWLNCEDVWFEIKWNFQHKLKPNSYRFCVIYFIIISI